VRGFCILGKRASSSRSGWDKRRIWLKLASKQRRHLDHNERSECLSKLASIKKAKSTPCLLLKGFDESHQKGCRSETTTISFERL